MSRMRVKQRPAKPKQCAVCTTSFVPHRNKRKYCSIACMRIGWDREGWREGPCDGCGVHVKRKRHFFRRAKSKKLFCTRECSTTYHTGALSPSWRGGESLRRGSSWPRQS